MLREVLFNSQGRRTESRQLTEPNRRRLFPQRTRRKNRLATLAQRNREECPPVLNRSLYAESRCRSLVVDVFVSDKVIESVTNKSLQNHSTGERSRTDPSLIEPSSAADSVDVDWDQDMADALEALSEMPKLH